MRVAIIGANGFVGRAVSRVLSKKGYYVHGFIRDAGINELPFIDKITHVSSADAEQDWRMLLAVSHEAPPHDSAAGQRDVVPAARCSTPPAPTHHAQRAARAGHRSTPG